MSTKRAIGAVIGVVGALVAGAVATSRALQASQEPAAAPAFEPAESAEIVAAREISWQPTADLVGTAIAVRSVMVRNEIAGVVRYVGAESGDTVEQGQVLLRLDDTTERADLEAAKAAVRVAEANIAAAESQIRLAEQELDRFSGVQSRAVAQVEVDRARTKVDTARADRGRWLAEADQARARVAQVEARLAKLTIAAPFRARAGMRSVHEGQYLEEGATVVALQELTDTIYLDFAVPQEYAPRIRHGTTVMATGALLGPRPVAITVVAVDSIVNHDTRNIRVRAVVANPDGTLVPGMSVQVRVPIDQAKNVVAVPTTAVRRAAYGNSIFVAIADEAGVLRAKQRFVTLGESVGEEIIVTQGLRAGERVAAAGSFKLRDGVRLLAAAPAPPGAQGAPAARSAPAAEGGKSGGHN